jgi:4-hydroxybenzoate polyprenyltransferase
MGRHVKGGVALCYGFALAGWGGALWAVRPDPLVLIALLPAAVHFTGQLVTLDPANGEDALAKFRSNRFAGLLVFAAMLVVGMAP